MCNCSDIKFSKPSMIDVGVAVMASVMHRHANLYTPFKSLITLACWVFGHHTTGCLVISSVFSTYFPAPAEDDLYFICSLLNVCVPGEFLIEDNFQVFYFFGFWNFQLR